MQLRLRSPWIPHAISCALLLLVAGSAQAAPSGPWKSCFRVFVPTPDLGEIPVFTLCESRTLPGATPHSRALGFFRGEPGSIPDRAFEAALIEDGGCAPNVTPSCRAERWESRNVLEPEALSRGEIKVIGPDPRFRTWTFQPGALTRSLTSHGIVTIEATPNGGDPSAPPRSSEARWERLNRREMKALLAPTGGVGFNPTSAARFIASSDCAQVPLVAVTPVPRTTRLSDSEWRRKGAACDGRNHDLCKHVSIEQSIEPSSTIKGALRLVHSNGGPEIERDFMPLLRSSAIRSMLRLMKTTRENAGDADACRPVPVTVAKPGTEFGTGPALIDGMRFELDGRSYDGLIAIEDASLAGRKMLSMEALRKHGIEDLVIAHELAHAMMQELYGNEAFDSLTSGIVSRDGHNASATTDPALAWVEGFAEAFEAHFGWIQTGSRIDPSYAPQMEEALDFFNESTREMAAQDDFSVPFYLNFVAAAVGKAGELLGKLDLLMAELLKLERQDPIRSGFYVLANRFGNFPVQLGHDSSLLVPDRVVESAEELASREGIVAHLVYLLLHKGYEKELLEVIRTEKPSDLFDFLNAFARRQPKIWNQSGLANRVGELLDPQARQALADANRLQYRLGDFGAPKSDAPWTFVWGTGGPARTPPPKMPLPTLRSAWLEFHSHSKARIYLQGTLDRIDLFTAPIERVIETFSLALEMTSDLDRSQRDAATPRLAGSWIQYRKRLLPNSLDSRKLGGPAYGAIRDDELDGWTEDASTPSDRILRRRIAGFIRSARDCSQTGCETPRI